MDSSTRAGATEDKRELSSLNGMVAISVISAVVVAESVLRLWSRLGGFGRVFVVVFFCAIPVQPALELWRRRSGKPVRYERLAAAGYALLLMAAVIFAKLSD